MLPTRLLTVHRGQSAAFTAAEAQLLDGDPHWQADDPTTPLEEPQE
ncbi:hypothetical protein [Crossiella sp. NPDC003009]